MPAPAPAAAKDVGNGGKLSGPAARQEAHAAKMKSKSMRKNRTPGPGAYSPAGMGVKISGAGKPSSSFKSSTIRMQKDLAAMEMGDPGSYDPYTLKELSHTSKKSFAKSMRGGSGSFGTREQREMRVDVMGEKTPGPGAYNGDVMMKDGKKANLSALDTGEKMPSSAFKSKTDKHVKYPNEGVPGAGAYSPAWTAIEPQQMNPGCHFKAQGKRFEAVKEVTEPMVGPGSYEAHVLGSMATSVKESVSKASRANPGFGTLMPAHELPFLDEVQDAVDMPGPGAYDTAKSTLENNAGHKSAFKSGSQRADFTKDGSLDPNGDPGSYDPYTHMELATTSKKSFGRSSRSGMADFGTKEQRALHIDIMGEKTPGPGAYNGDVMMKDGKKANLSALDTGEKMPSSAFKSKTDKHIPFPNEHVPGPGAHTPQWTAIESQQMNPAHSLKAKGTRFQGADKWAREQATEPGPGAYETEILRTGGRSALSAYDTGEQMPSGAFASDTIRDLPWPSASKMPAPPAAKSSS